MAKILLAEDDPGVSVMVETFLDGEGHTVDTATNGNYAFDLLLHYDYDLAILDWHLPDKSGMEICQQYRSEGGTAAIIFLTGKTDIDSKVLGLDAGADDYLCKPFHARELSARVRALLRRSATERKLLLTDGDISFDPLSRTVTRAGKEVEFSRKELAILEFFLRHPNETFTTEALVARIWSSESEVSPETVRPYIKHIRAKLEGEDGSTPLVTVHGSGYMWQKRKEA